MNEFEWDWISWSQSFVQNGWIQDGRIQDGCHHQVEWEWLSEIFCPKWLNWRWKNSIWLPSSSWVRMNEWRSFLCTMAESMIAEFKMAAIINLSENAWVMFFCANGWIQDGRIQYGCHHQVHSEWMTLSQIELVGVRVWAKWLNPRWQKSRWLPSSS